MAVSSDSFVDRRVIVPGGFTAVVVGPDVVAKGAFAPALFFSGAGATP